MYEVRFPKLVTLRTSAKMIELCEDGLGCPEAEVLFDLEDVKFITPIGVTCLAGYIRKCQQLGKSVHYRRPENLDPRQYLSAIGFHSYFRLNDKHEESRITRTDLKQIYYIDIGYIEGLLEVLNHHMNLSPRMNYSIDFSLKELMTNVNDHSETPIGCFICSQYTPFSGLIRICITDFGIGIRQALRKSPKYRKLRTSADAIKLAVEEGVSSRERRAQGLGLTLIRNFLRVNGGTLSITSENTKVNFYHNKTEVKPMKVPFNGTIVKLRINSDKDSLYFLKEEEDMLF